MLEQNKCEMAVDTSRSIIKKMAGAALLVMLSAGAVFGHTDYMPFWQGTGAKLSDFENPRIDPLLGEHVWYARSLMELNDGNVTPNGNRGGASWLGILSPNRGKIGAAGTFRTYYRAHDNVNANFVIRNRDGAYIQDIAFTSVPTLNFPPRQLITVNGESSLFWGTRATTGNVVGLTYNTNALPTGTGVERGQRNPVYPGGILPKFPDIRNFNYSTEHLRSLGVTINTSDMGGTLPGGFRPGYYPNINITSGTTQMVAGTYFIPGNMTVNSGATLELLSAGTITCNNINRTDFRTVIYLGGNLSILGNPGDCTYNGGRFLPQGTGVTGSSSAGGWLTGTTYVAAEGQVLIIMTGNNSTPTPLAAIGANSAVLASIINPLGRIHLNHNYVAGNAPNGTNFPTQALLYGQALANELILTHVTYQAIPDFEMKPLVFAQTEIIIGKGEQGGIEIEIGSGIAGWEIIVEYTVEIDRTVVGINEADAISRGLNLFIQDVVVGSWSVNGNVAIGTFLKTFSGTTLNLPVNVGMRDPNAWHPNTDIEVVFREATTNPIGSTDINCLNIDFETSQLSFKGTWQSKAAPYVWDNDFFVSGQMIEGNAPLRAGQTAATFRILRNDINKTPVTSADNLTVSLTGVGGGISPENFVTTLTPVGNNGEYRLVTSGSFDLDYETIANPQFSVTVGFAVGSNTVQRSPATLNLLPFNDNQLVVNRPTSTINNFSNTLQNGAWELSIREGENPTITLTGNDADRPADANRMQIIGFSLTNTPLARVSPIPTLNSFNVTAANDAGASARTITAITNDTVRTQGGVLSFTYNSMPDFVNPKRGEFTDVFYVHVLDTVAGAAYNYTGGFGSFVTIVPVRIIVNAADIFPLEYHTRLPERFQVFENDSLRTFDITAVPILLGNHFRINGRPISAWNAVATTTEPELRRPADGIGAILNNTLKTLTYSIRRVGRTVEKFSDSVILTVTGHRGTQAARDAVRNNVVLEYRDMESLIVGDSISYEITIPVDVFPVNDIPTAVIPRTFYMNEGSNTIFLSAADRDEGENGLTSVNILDFGFINTKSAGGTKDWHIDALSSLRGTGSAAGNAPTLTNGSFSLTAEQIHWGTYTFTYTLRDVFTPTPALAVGANYGDVVRVWASGATSAAELLQIQNGTYMFGSVHSRNIQFLDTGRITLDIRARNINRPQINGSYTPTPVSMPAFVENRTQTLILNISDADFGKTGLNLAEQLTLSIHNRVGTTWQPWSSLVGTASLSATTLDGNGPVTLTYTHGLNNRANERFVDSVWVRVLDRENRETFIRVNINITPINDIKATGKNVEYFVDEQGFFVDPTTRQRTTGRLQDIKLIDSIPATEHDLPLASNIYSIYNPTNFRLNGTTNHWNVNDALTWNANNNTERTTFNFIPPAPGVYEFSYMIRDAFVASAATAGHDSVFIGGGAGFLHGAVEIVGTVSMNVKINVVASNSNRPHFQNDLGTETITSLSRIFVENSANNQITITLNDLDLVKNTLPPEVRLNPLEQLTLSIVTSDIAGTATLSGTTIGNTTTALTLAQRQLTLTYNHGTASGRPASEEIFTDNIVLRVTDRAGNFANLTITITITPVNDNLVIARNHNDVFYPSNASALNISQGGNISFDLRTGATDVDLGGVNTATTAYSNPVVATVVNNFRNNGWSGLEATTRTNTTTSVSTTTAMFNYENDGTPGIWTFDYQLIDGFLRDGLTNVAGNIRYYHNGITEITSPTINSHSAVRSVTVRVKAANTNVPTGTNRPIVDPILESGTTLPITLRISDADLWKNSLTGAGVALDEKEELTIDIIKPFSGRGTLPTVTWAAVDGGFGSFDIDNLKITGDNFTQGQSWKEITLTYKDNDPDGTNEIPFADTLIYRVIDRRGEHSTSCTIIVNITPVNDNRPIAHDASVFVNIGQWVYFNPIATSNPGDPAAYTIATVRGRFRTYEATDADKWINESGHIVDTDWLHIPADFATDLMNPANTNLVFKYRHNNAVVPMADIQNVYRINVTQTGRINTTTDGNDRLRIIVDAGATRPFDGYFEYIVTDKTTNPLFDPGTSFEGVSYERGTGLPRVYLKTEINPNEITNWGNAGAVPGTLAVFEASAAWLSESRLLDSARTLRGPAVSDAANTNLTNLLSRVGETTNSRIKADRVVITTPPDPEFAEIWGRSGRKSGGATFTDWTLLEANDTIDGEFEYRHKVRKISAASVIAERFQFKALLPAAFTNNGTQIASNIIWINPSFLPRNDQAPTGLDKSGQESVKQPSGSPIPTTITVIADTDTDPDDWGGTPESQWKTNLRIAAPTEFNFAQIVTARGMLARDIAGNQYVSRLNMPVTINPNNKTIQYSYTGACVPAGGIQDTVFVVVIDPTSGTLGGGEGNNWNFGTPVPGEHRIHPVVVRVLIDVKPNNLHAPVFRGTAGDKDTVEVYVGWSRDINFTRLVDGTNIDEIPRQTRVDGPETITTVRFFGATDLDCDYLYVSGIKEGTQNFGTGGQATYVDGSTINIRGGTQEGPFEVVYIISDGERPVERTLVVIVASGDALPLPVGAAIQVNEGGSIDEVPARVGTDRMSNPDNKNLLHLVDKTVFGNFPATQIKIISLPTNGELWVYKVSDINTQVRITQADINGGNNIIDGRFEYRHTANKNNPVIETAAMFIDGFNFAGITEVGVEGPDARVSITILPQNNHAPVLTEKKGFTVREDSVFSPNIRLVNPTTNPANIGAEGFDWDFDINTTLRINRISASKWDFDPLSITEIVPAIRTIPATATDSLFTVPGEFEAKIVDNQNIQVRYFGEVQHKLDSTITIYYTVIDPTPYCPANQFTDNNTNDVPNRIHEVMCSVVLRIIPQNNFAPEKVIVNGADTTYLPLGVVSDVEGKNTFGGDTLWITYARNVRVNPLATVVHGPLDNYRNPLNEWLASINVNEGHVIRSHRFIDKDGDYIVLHGLATKFNDITTITPDPIVFGKTGNPNAITVEIVEGGFIRVVVGIDFELNDPMNGDTLRVPYWVRDVPLPSYGGKIHSVESQLVIIVLNSLEPKLDELFVSGDNWTLNKGATTDSLRVGGIDVGTHRTTRNTTLLQAINERLFGTVGRQRNYIERFVLMTAPTRGQLLAPADSVIRGGIRGDTIDVGTVPVIIDNPATPVNYVALQAGDIAIGNILYKHDNIDRGNVGFDNVNNVWTDNFRFNVILSDAFGSLTSEESAVMNIRIKARNDLPPVLPLITRAINEGQAIQIDVIADGTDANVETTLKIPADENLVESVDDDSDVMDAWLASGGLIGETMPRVWSVENKKLGTDGNVFVSARDTIISYLYTFPPNSRRTHIEDVIWVQVIDPTPYCPEDNDNDAPENQEGFGLNETGARNKLNVVWRKVNIRVYRVIGFDLGSIDSLAMTLNEGALRDIITLDGNYFAGGTGKTLVRAIEDSLFGERSVGEEGLPDIITGIQIMNNGNRGTATVVGGNVQYKHTTPTEENDDSWKDSVEIRVRLNTDFVSTVTDEQRTQWIYITINPRNNHRPVILLQDSTFSGTTISRTIPISTCVGERNDPDSATTIKIPATTRDAGRKVVEVIRNSGAGELVVERLDDSTITYNYTFPQNSRESRAEHTIVVQVIDTTEYSYHYEVTPEIDRTNNLELNETGLRNYVSVIWDTIYVTATRVFDFDLDTLFGTDSVIKMNLNEGALSDIMTMTTKGGRELSAGGSNRTLLQTLEYGLFGSGNDTIFAGLRITKIPAHGQLLGRRIVDGNVRPNFETLAVGDITTGEIRYRHTDTTTASRAANLTGVSFEFEVILKDGIQSEDDVNGKGKVEITINPRNNMAPVIVDTIRVTFSESERRRTNDTVFVVLTETEINSDRDDETTVMIANTSIRGDSVIVSRGLASRRTDGISINYRYIDKISGMPYIEDTVWMVIVDPTPYCNENNLDDAPENQEGFGLNGNGVRNTIHVAEKVLIIRINQVNEHDSVSWDLQTPVVHIVKENDEVIADGVTVNYPQDTAPLRAVYFGVQFAGVDTLSEDGFETWLVDGDGDTLRFSVESHSNHDMGELVLLNQLGHFKYIHYGEGVEIFTDSVVIFVTDREEGGHELRVTIPIKIIPMLDEDIVIPDLKLDVNEGKTTNGGGISIIDIIRDHNKDRIVDSFPVFDGDILCNGTTVKKDTVLTSIITITVEGMGEPTTLPNGALRYENELRVFVINPDGTFEYTNKVSVSTKRLTDTVNLVITISNPLYCDDGKIVYREPFVFAIKNIAPVAVGDTIFAREGETTTLFGRGDNQYRSLKGIRPTTTNNIADGTDPYQDWDLDTPWDDLFVWLLPNNPFDPNDNFVYPTAGTVKLTDNMGEDVITELGVDGRPIDVVSHRFGSIRYTHDGTERHLDEFWYVLSDGISEDTGHVVIIVERKPSQPYDPRDPDVKNDTTITIDGDTIIVHDSRLPHYEDVNADGTIDRISISFRHSIPARGGRPDRDSTDFELTFGGNPVTIDSVTWNDNMFRDNKNVWVYVSGMPEYTTSGLMNMKIHYRNFPLSTAAGERNPLSVQVFDRAAPVVVSARYFRSFTAEVADTLVVELSEHARFNTANNPFFVWKPLANAGLAVGLTEILPRVGNTSRFVLNDGFKGQIARGDSININRDANVRDNSNTIQANHSNIRQPIDVQMFNPLVSAAYFDRSVPRNGFIDLIRVYAAAGVNDRSVLEQLKTALVLPRGLEIDSIVGRVHGFDIFVKDTSAVPSTSVSASDILTLHNEIVSSDGVLNILPGTIKIADSIAPVIVSAHLVLSDEDTTITVTFSEPVDVEGGNPYLFLDNSTKEPFEMKFSLTEPRRTSPREFRYRVTEMEKAFPRDLDDSIKIVRANFVGDTTGNMAGETVWAPLRVTDLKALEIYNWLKIYPSPVTFARDRGRVEARELRHDLVSHYGIQRLHSAPRGMAFILEAGAELSEDLTQHSGRIAILDQTGNLVNELDMVFLPHPKKQGVITGIALWDCTNMNGRLIAPQNYIAVIEINVVLEEAQTTVSRTYRKSIGVRLPATK